MTSVPPTASLTDLVWIQTGFIGDVVLTTAAFELAASALPGCRQHVVTTPVGAQALAGSERLASRIVFDKAGKGTLSAFRAAAAALRAELTAGSRAVILQAHRSYRSSLLVRYLGLPAITYDETGFAWLAARTIPRVAPLHEAARVALLLEPLGVPRAAIVAARPRLAPLPLTPDGGWQARLLAAKAAGQRLVAVAPGSVWGTKRWTPDGYAALARTLSAPHSGLLVVLLGSSGERPLAEQVESAAGPGPQLLNLAGLTSLDDLRRIFPQLSLLVANDSSPVHFASAFDVPTIEIFGATVPAMGFGPLARRSRALGVELPCRPCSDHGPKTCPLGHFRCMRELKVETVLGACQEILGDERS